jgi:DNA-binding SARP family transcriptional activator
VESGVLGSLFVRVGGRSHAPSAHKLRCLLAMLVLHASQVVSVPSLMRELWVDGPPASGITTLQTYVLNLRKWLAATADTTAERIAREVLVTHTGGYSLQVDTGGLDVHIYNRLVAAGREALSAGEYEVGAQRLSEALQVWRGPALADVHVGRVLESKRRQLEESRLVAVEYLIDARLRLGRYWEVLTELAALLVENPLHEGLHAQYMRALYFSGRRAQALAAFQQLRSQLISELGLEPGPSVQQVHQAILNAEGDGMETQLVGYQVVPGLR